jgi:hypothetical protein
MSNLYKKYYDVSRLILWADGESDDSGARRARMVIGFRDGNPRITVYTGGTGSEAVISFPTDPITMVAAMNYLKDVIKAPPGTKMSIESLTTVYENNRPTKEKKVLSTLYLGKSKDGLIYMSVISEGRAKLIFTIKASPYHVFRDGDKNVLAEAKVSEMLASGIADMALNVVAQVLVQYTNEEYTDGGRKQTEVKNPNGGSVASHDKIEILQDLDDISL